MPGMMETVLDVGVNDETIEGLMRLTGNPRLAWDCYRRLIQGFAEVVQGLDTEPFDELTRQALAIEGVENERMLDHRALQRLVQAMFARFRDAGRTPFPAITSRPARAGNGCRFSFLGCAEGRANIAVSIISAMISARR